MFELWRKKRELDKIIKFYDVAIKKAKKEKKSSDEIDSLVNELFADQYAIEEEMKSFVSMQFIKKAYSLFLPVPARESDDMWEVGDVTGLYYLTPKGIMEVRSLIREETAARRKAVLEWASPFIGIIGATTGLLAVVLAMT